MILIIVTIVVLVVAIPVGFLMSTSIAAAALGSLLTRFAEDTHPDSELLDTNY